MSVDHTEGETRPTGHSLFKCVISYPSYILHCAHSTTGGHMEIMTKELKTLSRYPNQSLPGLACFQHQCVPFCDVLKRKEQVVPGTQH